MTDVPAQYQSYVNNAAAAIGIPAAVVAAQINDESGWNPNAVSPAGAVGIAQFLPSTFNSVHPGGSPYNVADAFAAYTTYMKQLLGQFGGNLRNALAAYNAGPGNIGAGMGYANSILSQAGSGDITVAGAGTPTSSFSAAHITTAQSAGFFDWFGKIGQWFMDGGGLLGGFGGSNGGAGGAIGQGIDSVGAIFQDINEFFKMISLLFNPAFWLRVGAFVMGLVLLVGGSVALISSVRTS